MKKAIFVSAGVFEIVFMVGGGILLGEILDRVFKTYIFKGIGVFAGFVSGIFLFIKIIKIAEKEKE